jgi:hypothetical protein
MADLCLAPFSNMAADVPFVNFLHFEFPAHYAIFQYGRQGMVFKPNF